MRKFPLLSLFFLMGSFSLAFQTLLIREYLIALEGNELAIGLFYATWFLWVAIGGGLVIWKRKIANFFFYLLPVYPLSAFLEFYLLQIIRKIAGVEPWELFLITKILPATIMVNFPFSLLTGILFSSGCRFLKLTPETNSQIVSQAYIWESMGSFTGGVIITYLITRLIPPLPVVLILSLMFVIVGLLATYNHRKKIPALYNLFLIFIFALFVTRYQKFQGKFESLRWQSLFPRSTIIAEVYTPYQHLAIAEVKKQKVLLANAKVITALGDKISGDKLSALLCAMGDLPSDILLIGYGCENLIFSLLKYKIKQIFYVLPDKTYINFVSRYLPPEMKNIFHNQRLKILYTDPRNFINTTPHKFDLVVLNLPDPKDSFINKYYTLEFYQSLKSHLKKRGIIALKITSAENYIGTELKNYGSSIYYTLKECFSRIVIVPGSINWFLAGGESSPLTSDPRVLSARYKKFIPLDSSFYPQGFYSLLPKDRVEFVEKSYARNRLFEKFKLWNTDRKPLSYFLNLIVQFRYANSRLPLFLKSIFVSGWVFFVFPVIVIGILRIHYLKFIYNNPLSRTIFLGKTYQFFSGCTGFIYQLILIYLFQRKFGTIFHYIGLVNSIFMLGLFAGSYLGRILINKVDTLRTIATLLVVQFLIYILSYPLGVKFISLLPDLISWGIYIFLFLSSGIITGISYPLAGNLIDRTSTEIVTISGNLEALDHWGAALGAIMGGILLIPLLGIYNSLIFLSFLTFTVLFMVGMEIGKFPRAIKQLNPSKLSYPYIKSGYFLFAISLWIIFSFNYLEDKEKTISHTEIEIPGMKFDRIQQKNSPFPYYLGYKHKHSFYIFRTRELNTSGKGFGGDIDLAIVTDRNGKIKKIIIENSRESPWHLTQVKSWLKNFQGRNICAPLKPGKNIDALTGATVSANGVISGITKTAPKVSRLFRIRISEGKLHITREELYRSAILIIFILTGIFLATRRKINYKLRMVYLILVVVIIGWMLKLQLNTAQVVNILDLNFPSPNNLTMIILISFPFLLGILWGRIYCGWFCPWGAVQEILSHIKPLSVSQHLDRKLRFFKFLLLSLIIILYFSTRNPNIFIQEPLYQAYFGKMGLAKTLLLTAFLFSLFFPRFWCKYFCPLGALLGLLNKIAILKSSTSKKFGYCNYKAKTPRDPECLQCNLCGKDER